MYKCVTCGRVFDEGDVIWVECPESIGWVKTPTCSVICAEKCRDAVIEPHQKIIDFMKKQKFQLFLSKEMAREVFTATMPVGVCNILQQLHRAGYEAYIVGGCVRDVLLGRQPHDWDICTSARPEQTKQALPDSRCIDTGLQHGTITVCCEDGMYEITTYRIDGEYDDGRHPRQVTFSTALQDDLARRDFTINAMAYSEEQGLLDYFDGYSDLCRGVIRCVGNPDERFQEDALRILRALRFASVYGFQLEDYTANNIIQSRQLLLHISAERIRDELCKLLTGKAVEHVLEIYRDVLAAVIPELQPSFYCKQNNPYHIYDVWHHTLKAVANSQNDLYIRLALLFHDIGKPDTKSTDENGKDHFYGHPKRSAELTKGIMRRLRFDNESIRIVTELISIHNNHIEENPALVRRFLNRVGPEQFMRFLFVREADLSAQAPELIQQRLETAAAVRKIAQDIVESQQCFGLKDLAINGCDLIAAGMKPGPALGAKLQAALEFVLEHPDCNTHDILVNFCLNE